MAKPIVLVTEPEYRRGQPVFASTDDLECVVAPPEEAPLAELVGRSGARYVVIGPVFYRDCLYAALPKGGVLARYGVGHESVDKAKATDSGLLCTNTPDVLHQSVAELTLTMIGAAARHVLGAATALRQGEWAPREGIELEGTTLALIGCGAIGQAVARIAAAGFGMRVVGYQRRPVAPGGADLPPHFDRVTNDFADAVRDADFVSLHIPGSPENARFMSAERLALVPPRAWLINTARGAVVDEAALYDSLAAGRLGGAALDVFDREPYVPADPSKDLRTLPQVLPLPHIGSNTTAANRRMAERALRNVRLAHAGDVAALDLLNPEVLAAGRPARPPS